MSTSPPQESQEAEVKLPVRAEVAGKRVDLFVKEVLHLSRADAKRLFDEGRVRVDGRVAKKGQGLTAGQTVTLRPLPTDTTAQPDLSLALDVLHEDESLLFLNKPPHMPTHPLRPMEQGTLANAIVARYPQCAQASEDPREGGLCHRLDVETSGVILAAKSREAWNAVREAFSRRGDVDKRYWALAVGPLADEGEIDVPLRHHPKHPDRVEPTYEGAEGAREAVSSFQVIARQGFYSLVEVRIHTGVLHQVRAHLAAIGAPLVGDRHYGGPDCPGLDRFFLHARSLALLHPLNRRRLSVQAPLPRDLASILEGLGLSP